MKEEINSVSKFREYQQISEDDRFTFEDCQIIKELCNSEKLTEREKMAIKRLYITYDNITS